MGRTYWRARRRLDSGLQWHRLWVSTTRGLRMERCRLFRRLPGVGRCQRLVLVIALAASSGWGCQAGYRLTIDNVDAPAVQVTLNGSLLGGLACADAPLQLSAGAALPPLPWEIVLRYDNGRETGP